MIHFEWFRIWVGFLGLLVVGWSGSVRAEERSEQVRSVSGHVFIRDRSVPAFGVAWRDESGMIWSTALRKEGRVATMDHFQAEKICKSIGANLPSREDFERLKSYLLTRETVVNGEIQENEGYEPQVLPDLAGNLFWSSTRNEFFSRSVYVFVGSTGNAGDGIRDFDRNAVRCVIQR
jgi:hypothetical protein